MKVQTRHLFAMARLSLALGLAACSGDKGDKGDPGATGSAGAPGQQGNLGPQGPGGQNGQNGVSVGNVAGFVRSLDSSAAVAGAIVTTEPASSSVTTGADGAFSFANLPIGVYAVTASAAGYNPLTITNVSVTAARTATVTLALGGRAELGQVSGQVLKHASVPRGIVGAKVTLLEAADVVTSTSNDPLHSLSRVAALAATTDANGDYVIANVPPGRYFIHAEPGPADVQEYLPGGNTSRSSFTVEAGAAIAKEITLSQRPSDAATYVGSGQCLFCHGTAALGEWKETLHALVYRRPGVASANQDLTPYPNHDRALVFFKDSTVDAANTRDNTGAGDVYGLRISQAGGFSAFPASYNLLLGFENGQYFVVFESAGGTRSSRYYTDFSFGGHGIYKARWITRVATNQTYTSSVGGDSSYYILPLQFDEQLQAGVEPFHPYNASNWGPPTVANGPAARPAQNKSFDLNCAGCHFTGMGLTVDGQGNFKASAANTTGGPMDYDGNGQSDDMTIGCEACHGPGSEHVSSPGPGKDIVAPSFLSAERASMICGQCHTRGEGRGVIGGSLTEYPSAGTGTLRFPKPGMSYEEFERDFQHDNPGTYGDDTHHSRQHHQQYVDFMKSKHFKNENNLLECSDCHDLHNRNIGASLTAPDDDNTLCLNCHAPDGLELGTAWTPEEEAEAVAHHMGAYASMTVGYDPENLAGLGASLGTPGVGRCSTCHMPKTASSQSRFVHETVNAQNQPAGARIRGDISSHAFEVIWPATSQALYNTASTNRQLPNSCGICHNDIVGIGPNYVY